MSDSLDAGFDALVQALAESGRYVRDHPFFSDPENRASGYAFVLAMLMGRIEEEVVFDPDFPYFRSVDTRIREAGDNPDQRYWSARVRGGQSYRIWGNMGTARRFDLQVYAGIPAQPGGSGRSAGFISYEDLEVGRDGSFEIVATPDRQPGNWVACPPDATRVIVRQVYSDWDRELPGHVHIDRIGGEGEPKPPLADDDMAARLHAAAASVTTRVPLWPEMVRTTYMDGPPNELSPLFDPAALGGVPGRWMSHGIFDLAPEEALVVRMWPGNGNYQGIQLGDLWFSSLEYANRQTSLSGDQARIGEDGSYWIVVSAQDPGVVNWLDTMGRRRGFLLIRYDGTVGTPFAADRQPQCHVVPMAELHQRLPGDMAHTTAAQRRRDVAKRRRHVQRRFAN